MKWLGSFGDRFKKTRVQFASGDGDERPTLILSRRGQPPERFLCAMRVCGNPGCPCHNLTLELSPADGVADGDPGGVSAVPLDLDERAIRSSVTGDTKRAQDILDGMDEEAWNRLEDEFLHAKQQQLRDMDLDRIDVAFSGEVLSGESNMMGYLEAFPFARILTFALGGSEWAADDFYCVDPKCKCRDAALTFIRLPKEGERKQDETETRIGVAGLYDYGRGRFTEIGLREEHCPRSADLMAALEAQEPDLGSIVRERHRQLRYLLKKRRREQHLERLAERDESGKVGRNSPCPCGSGKKYKQCCGQ